MKHLSNIRLVHVVENIMIHVVSIVIECLRELELTTLAIKLEDLKTDILLELDKYNEQYTGG